MSTYLYIVGYIGLAILGVLMFALHRAKTKKAYFEHEYRVEAPIQVDPVTKTVSVAGVHVSFDSKWGRIALEGSCIKAWKMEEGIITEVDLERGREYLQEVAKDMLPNEYVLKTATDVRRHIEKQLKVENIRVGIGMGIAVLALVYFLLICACFAAVGMPALTLT